MTSTSFDSVFDTSKPIFILEVINVISEAAKAQMERLQNAFKKRAEHIQAMVSSLAKLGKSRKSNKFATAQSEAYGSSLSTKEIAALLAATAQSKNDLNGKGGGGTRGL